MLKKILKSPFFSCLIIVLIFLFVANNYWSRNERHINSDGRGYYEYLPAIFIYKDLKLTYLDKIESKFYDSNVMRDGFYPKINGQRNNKYYIGTAILQLPVFLINHLFTKNSGKDIADGFSEPYQKAMYLNALLFFFLGLLSLFKLLKSFGVSHYLSFISLLGISFCTSLAYYIYIDSCFSHVYSFAVISFFCLSVRNYHLSHSNKFIFFAVISLCLIVLLRPVNALVILFIPFLFSSLEAFKMEAVQLFQTKKLTFVLACLSGFTLFFLQSLVWYFTYGKWIVYPYGDEGFIWGHEHFLDFLVSVEKGFFFWSPWFLGTFVLGTITSLVLKKYQFLLLFFIPFYVLIFVLSSWWYWTYGMSLGSRPMVDFYPIFILLLIPCFTHFKKISIVFLTLFTLLTAPISISQVYQFQHYIIRCENMDWKGYKEIFMKVDRSWDGYLNKRKYVPIHYQIKNNLVAAELVLKAKEPIIVHTMDVDKDANKTLVARYTFDSQLLDEENWLDLYVKDSLGNIIKRETAAVIDLRIHPDNKSSFVMDIELPKGNSFYTVSLCFNNLDKPSKLKNLRFNLFEIK